MNYIRDCGIARVDAMNKLVEWMPELDKWKDGVALANLFGCRTYAELCDEMSGNRELYDKVRLLSGPNGYAIWRTMRAKSQTRG